MARIAIPNGYTSWNAYIDAMATAGADQTAAGRRLTKRNIKLGSVAQVERQAGGNVSSASYRVNNVYHTPGTVSPTAGHPWSTI